VTETLAQPRGLRAAFLGQLDPHTAREAVFCRELRRTMADEVNASDRHGGRTIIREASRPFAHGSRLGWNSRASGFALCSVRFLLRSRQEHDDD
jgi:hypothetical protein